MQKNIIIIGARGYHFNYGGWETFVTNLVANNNDQSYKYYIPNLTHNKKEDKQILEIDKVTVPYIYTPKQGFVTMFTFTIKAVHFFMKYIKEQNLKNCVILILGCKVGPFFPFWLPKFHKLGVKLIINPDGLEWKREKWSWWIKQCFKISERYSIKYSDYCVCDAKAIEEYVKKKYQKYQPRTTFIAYGAYLEQKGRKNEIVKKIFLEHQIKEKEYYLIVGRFIPENNYETMIKEFMKTKTKKDLVIICNLEKNKFYDYLEETTKFTEDKRIKFIGSVYDKDALRYMREKAYGYLHGHSAGGTNPSLLEALSSTNINILYDVDYNKEVGEESCFYFTKEEGSLAKVIQKTEKLSITDQKKYGMLAKQRIKEEYTWDIVVEKYQNLFYKLLMEKEKNSLKEKKKDI